MTVRWYGDPRKIDGLFLILILAEKALPDFLIRYKEPVKSINEKWNRQNYPEGFVDRNKVSCEYENRKAEVEKNHHRAEDGEYLVIHFTGAAHCILI